MSNNHNTASPHTVTIYPPEQQLLNNLYQLNNLRCSSSEYRVSSTPDADTLKARLENHLSMCHYHQIALLQLATCDNTPDRSEWELGAHLINYQLRQRSDTLIKQLCKIHTEALPE